MITATMTKEQRPIFNCTTTSASIIAIVIATIYYKASSVAKYMHLYKHACLNAHKWVHRPIKLCPCRWRSRKKIGGIVVDFKFGFALTLVTIFYAFFKNCYDNNGFVRGGLNPLSLFNMSVIHKHRIDAFNIGPYIGLHFRISLRAKSRDNRLL